MIRAVCTPADREAFAALARPYPGLHALFCRDAALWAGRPHAPVQLFLADGAALHLEGPLAHLCGQPRDEAELNDFLRLAQVRWLTAAVPLAALVPKDTLFLYRLPAGQQLAAGPPPAGLTRTEQPPMRQVADWLFCGQQTRADSFYSQACTALNHGCARAVALLDRDGGPVSAVGAYAIAEGEAFLSMGITAAHLRGQGIGGWLIADFANRLSAQGYTAVFVCEGERCRFYDRLGFARAGNYYRYTIEEYETPYA